jgi:membrane protein DedA with SNARE-associated domain
MDSQTILETYGYLAFYLLLIFEGVPIYLLGGILLSLGVFQLEPLLIAPVFIVLGDYIFYYLGRKFGVIIVDKYGKYFFLTKPRVDYLSTFFGNHKGKAIVLSKVAYGIGHNLMMVYGIIKGKWKNVWKWSLLGGTFSYILYMSVGYYLGEGYDLVKETLKEFSIAIVLVIVVLIIVAQVVARSINRKKVSRF